MSVALRGKNYGLRVENGRFFITESYLMGKEQEHRVEYTLGNRRIQHYLTTLTDGRIIVLPPSWDVQRQEWFHNMDIVRPEQPGFLEGNPGRERQGRCRVARRK